jgi:hypothetical protein
MNVLSLQTLKPRARDEGKFMGNSCSSSHTGCCNGVQEQ